MCSRLSLLGVIVCLFGGSCAIVFWMFAGACVSFSLCVGLIVRVCVCACGFVCVSVCFFVPCWCTCLFVCLCVCGVCVCLFGCVFVVSCVLV